MKFREKIDNKKKNISIISLLCFTLLLIIYDKFNVKVSNIQYFSIYTYLIIIIIYTIYLKVRSKHVIQYDEEIIDYKIKNKIKKTLIIEELIMVTYIIDKKEIYYVFVTENPYSGLRKTLHLNCKKYRRKDVLLLFKHCIDRNKRIKHDVLNNPSYMQMMNYTKQKF